MPQVQRAVQSGEMIQTFFQFIVMQTNQALFALGKHPKAPPNAPPPNYDLGKIYIDHLVMIQWKTEGNLTPDEREALTNAITILQNAYTEALKEREA